MMLTAIASEIRKAFPVGSKVVLDKMDDEYTHLPKGLIGMVTAVDDIGTIHVAWENGANLGIVFNEDACHLL